MENLDEMVNDEVMQNENLKENKQLMKMKRSFISEDIYINDFPLVIFFFIF